MNSFIQSMKLKIEYIFLVWERSYPTNKSYQAFKEILIKQGAKFNEFKPSKYEEYLEFGNQKFVVGKLEGGRRESY